MIYKIIIPGDPVAWQRPGVNRGRFYDQQKKQKESFGKFFKSAFQEKPLNHSILIGYAFAIEMPTSWSARKKQIYNGKLHEDKPDLDNLVKFINDAANGILWEDDRKISSMKFCYKMWSYEPKTFISFEEVFA